MRKSHEGEEPRYLLLMLNQTGSGPLTAKSEANLNGCPSKTSGLSETPEILRNKAPAVTGTIICIKRNSMDLVKCGSCIISPWNLTFPLGHPVKVSNSTHLKVNINITASLNQFSQATFLFLYHQLS